MPKDFELSQFRAQMQREIDNYVYKVPEGAIGHPMSTRAIAIGLSEMRAALIDAYWTMVEIRDKFDQIGAEKPPARRCAAVADDGKGIVLLYDPVEESFVLARKGTDGLSTFGVRGDAVGCFLAR